MFSPENFYYVIRENYADTHGSVMWIPRVNGTKDIFHFEAFFENPIDSENYVLSSVGLRCQKHYTYMYDQEPLYPNVIDRFRQLRLDNEDLKIHDIIKQASWGELLACFRPNIDIPIWCHSELNSSEINEITTNLFIPCYYWYHAFISRDWFRHYHCNKSLQPHDKSLSPYRFLFYARSKDGTRVYRQEIINQLRKHKDKILHNWGERYKVGPEYSSKINFKDAADAGIHLVAETLFNDNKIYLTEKVFKPMVMSQPFIVWGPPKTLETLRNYGFQTFDGIWSESYDAEMDHDKRMSMLLNLVNDLADMSSDKFQDLYHRCLPIIEHNRKWFYSEKFMLICWQELQNNFSQALEIRQEILQKNPGGQFFYVLNKNPGLLNLSTLRAATQQILLHSDDTFKQKILDTYDFVRDIM